MKRAMLSQPMAGKTDEEIVATREKAIEVLKEKGYEIVNTLFTDEWYSNESMKERGVVQFHYVFSQSLLKTCLCAMQHISAKDGKIPEVAESNTMQQWHMALISSMNKNCTGARR